jgi:hypothetical protein
MAAVSAPSPPARSRDPNDKYKWIALSNVTLGVLLAVLDGSIVLIAMPSIFRGIHLDPLQPANSFYLLWMILGFLVVTSVLIVSLGRLGDMYGRVKMYNLGFLVYTVASLLLTIDWMTGRDGAREDPRPRSWRCGAAGARGLAYRSRTRPRRCAGRMPARPAPGPRHRRGARHADRPRAGNRGAIPRAVQRTLGATGNAAGR